MEENELISKKELLQITGISYGQLYRWKRENLIPEAWFIKRSSFTGQETYFPRTKILQRMDTILELKDRYSLEELANLFSPEVTKKLYSRAELDTLEELGDTVVELFSEVLEKKDFNFTEVLFMYVTQCCSRELKMKAGETQDLALNAREWLKNLKDIQYRYVVCRREGETFALLLQQDAPLLLDIKTRELKVFYLEELSKDLKLKFNERWGEL